MNRKDRTQNIRFAGTEERGARRREPLYVQLRIQITGYLTTERVHLQLLALLSFAVLYYINDIICFDTTWL